MTRADVLARALLVTGLAALSACTTTGHGKNMSPTLKVFKTEHPRPAPSDPIRSGAIELRVSKVFLEERATIFKTQGWVGKVRGVVVSSEALPVSALSDAFTLLGKSGTVYRAHVSTVGPGRSTWQHKEHTGQPTHLPANVAGELELWADVGDETTHDELVGFTFNGIHVPLSP